MRGGAWGGWGAGESQGGLKRQQPMDPRRAGLRGRLRDRGRGAGRGGAGAWWSGPLSADRARTGPKERAAAERRAGLGHGGKLGRVLRKEMERVGPAGLGWVGSWVLGGFRGLLFSFSISNSNKSI